MTVPVANLEAERRVVGSILSASAYSVDAGWEIMHRISMTQLESKDFWSDTNRELFVLLKVMAARGIACDPLSVATAIDTRALRKIGALKSIVDDGLWQERAHARLSIIAAEATAFSNVEHFCRLVRKAALARRRQEAGRA